mmetsp:Transcript_67663/g.153119  ORF Transcript_67663/g.153119 Transcript_67663/m.153119 type:complete len:116 (+) Transcript_67663:108-455(+)
MAEDLSKKALSDLHGEYQFKRPRLMDDGGDQFEICNFTEERETHLAEAENFIKDHADLVTKTDSARSKNKRANKKDHAETKQTGPGERCKKKRAKLASEIKTAEVALEDAKKASC